MIIRKANVKDIKECLEIQRLDKRNYWKDVDLKKSIKDRLVIFLVAEKNKNIIGYTIGFFSPTKRAEVMLVETRIHKDYRHKKVGTMLVRDFCLQAFKKGGKCICAEVKFKHLKFYVGSCKFKKTDNWIEVTKKR